MWPAIDPDDNIVAIASAPGGAARSVVRLSGSSVLNCLDRCFRPAGNVRLSAIRRATAIDGAITLAGLDRPLACRLYYWPTSRSYTRQPSAELHMVGSPPLAEAGVAALCAAGARVAEPGEFTLRSFLAGRIDLTQAEAVLGVINARGRRDLDLALEQLSGGLGEPLRNLRESLLDLLADLEAGLDFVDEEIEFVARPDVQRRLAEAVAAVDRLVEKMNTRHEHADAVRVVLFGWPNVGKSSLFNALAGDRRALVSRVPGTTRDYLTARIDLDGVLCELIDTAGIEPVPPAAGVARLAQQQSARQHEVAALRVLCLDSTRPLNQWEQSRLASPGEEPCVLVLTKIDAPAAAGQPSRELPAAALPTSSVTGAGIGALRKRLTREAAAAAERDCEVVGQTALRCRDSLREASGCLNRALDLVQSAGGEELVTLELRTALDELGRVVGAVYTDDILERIFSRFCIGK